MKSEYIAASIGGGAAVLAGIIQSIRWGSRSQKATNPEVTSAPQRRLESIRKSGRIRAGCIKHAPLCDFTSDGSGFRFEGLYVELARLVAEREGLVIDFIPIDWSELRHAFDPDRYDADLVLSVFDTAGRRMYADFTAPLHKIGVGAVMRDGDDRVKIAKDLSNPEIKIVVARGEAGWEYVKFDLETPRERVIVVENSNLSYMMNHVLSGEADVAICDNVTCALFCASNATVCHALKDDPLYLCKNAIMVRKDDKEFAKWVGKRFREALESNAGGRLETTLLADYLDLIKRHS